MAGAGSNTVIVVRSGPGTTGARRALATAAESAGRGELTTLALVGDGVLLARDADVAGAQVVCLADDVAMRGFKMDSRLEAGLVDYAQLVELLMEAKNVVGAL